MPAELLELAGKETLIGGTATVTFAMVLLVRPSALIPAMAKMSGQDLLLSTNRA